MIPVHNKWGFHPSPVPHHHPLAQQQWFPNRSVEIQLKCTNINWDFTVQQGCHPDLLSSGVSGCSKNDSAGAKLQLTSVVLQLDSLNWLYQNVDKFIPLWKLGPIPNWGMVSGWGQNSGLSGGVNWKRPLLGVGLTLIVSDPEGNAFHVRCGRC